MPRTEGTGLPEPDVRGLTARRDALRQAAALQGADPGPLLDAALAELDGAVDALTALRERAAYRADAPSEALRMERRLLRAVFQETPMPLFLLEPDGTVRRANRSAGGIIGSLPAYATGKPFTVFVDLPSRAAVQTHLAAVARTGHPRRIPCRLLGGQGVVDAELTVELITLAGDASVLLVAAGYGGQPPAGPGAGAAAPAGAAAAREQAAVHAVRSMARRMDLVTSVTRMLLDSGDASEPVTLRRCARMLAGGFASWVIIDIVEGGVLRRQCAAGPQDEQSQALARSVIDAGPRPGTLPWQVHDARRSLLLARADDTGVLGTGPDGLPLLMKLGLTSVLSVPISSGDTAYGVLTAARRADDGQFEIADLGLAEELGTQLGAAIRAGRLSRRRSGVTGAPRAGLLPRRPPEVPGMDLAAAHVGATEGPDTGGGFCDVYQVPGGWGVAIGGTCGTGEEAVAVTVAARHVIRALARRERDPADVLRRANEVLLDEEFGDRFVTAGIAYLTRRDAGVHVVLAAAGHPGPAVVRADGQVRLIGGGGLPLGLFPDAEPGTGKLDLADGDLLFFHSGGLTETRSPGLACFEEKLSDALTALAGRSAAEIVEAVRAQVAGLCGGEIRDDLTLLAVRVCGPPA